MRIWLVEFLPEGGLFQFSFHLGEALARAGHDVTLLTGPGPELIPSEPGMRVAEVFPTWHLDAGPSLSRWRQKARRAGRSLRWADSWRRLARLARRHRPDVVQVGDLRFALDCAFLVWLARRHSTGVLADVAHNPLPYRVHARHGSVERRDRFNRRARRAAYEAFDVVFALGEGPRRQLAELYPTVEHVVVTGHVPYAGQVDAVPAVGPPSTAARVLFFGTWTRYKNIDLLLDAFALVRAQRPDAELVMAGVVAADTSFEAIEQRARDIGGIELRPGYVAIDDVAKLFGQARVVALPYELVNISGVVHLAYSYGRPVVASDVGSMRDVVRDGETGFAVPPGAASFAAALVRLLDEPGLADRLGQAGRYFVDHESSADAVAARFVDGYEAAQARSAAGALAGAAPRSDLAR
jgi:glycosyltransferase involved in cell wall biosynthesis